MKIEMNLWLLKKVKINFKRLRVHWHPCQALSGEWHVFRLHINKNARDKTLYIWYSKRIRCKRSVRRFFLNIFKDKEIKNKFTTTRSPINSIRIGIESTSSSSSSCSTPTTISDNEEERKIILNKKEFVIYTKIYLFYFKENYSFVLTILEILNFLLNLWDVFIGYLK